MHTTKKKLLTFGVCCVFTYGFVLGLVSNLIDTSLTTPILISFYDLHGHLKETHEQCQDTCGSKLQIEKNQGNS